MTLPDRSTLDVLFRLGLAFVLALPLGWERAGHSRSAGLRTYPLLSFGACGALLIAQKTITHDATEQSNIFYGLLTGIGFVGSGAIIKSPEGTHGMATAVSLWVTGAIGAGVAYGLPQVSAALAVMTVLALRLLDRTPHS